jgi:hypothetical protein
MEDRVDILQTNSPDHGTLNTKVFSLHREFGQQWPSSAWVDCSYTQWQTATFRFTPVSSHSKNAKFDGMTSRSRPDLLQASTYTRIEQIPPLFTMDTVSGQLYIHVFKGNRFLA